MAYEPSKSTARVRYVDKFVDGPDQMHDVVYSQEVWVANWDARCAVLHVIPKPGDTGFELPRERVLRVERYA